MSGSSFDYVCYDMEDPEWADRAILKLIDMRDRAGTEFPEIVPHIEDMLKFIYKFNEEYLERGKKIKDLLQAVEWYYSGDWGADSVIQELEKLSAKEG